mgnify:CR=1 FL=1
MTPVEVGEEVRHASGLVLASTSPYRRSLLERLGIPFQVVAPRIDEESLKVPGEDPERLARRLARSKAESLIEFAPGAIIIGSDQVAAFEGTTWGKPGSRAGAAAQLVGKEGKYAQINMPSGEMRMVLIDCRAVIGKIGNSDHMNVTIGKAGRTRWKGIRPFVRGSAMNPCDHPHGGGEAKTSRGRTPVSLWGKPAQGYKTRKKKNPTNRLIISRRKK